MWLCWELQEGVSSIWSDFIVDSGFIGADFMATSDFIFSGVCIMSSDFIGGGLCVSWSVRASVRVSLQAGLHMSVCVVLHGSAHVVYFYLAAKYSTPPSLSAPIASTRAAVSHSYTYLHRRIREQSLGPSCPEPERAMYAIIIRRARGVLKGKESAHLQLLHLHDFDRWVRTPAHTTHVWCW